MIPVPGNNRYYTENNTNPINTVCEQNAKSCLIYTFILNIIVFNATLGTSVFTLVLHVSATLGHHQVLLLLLLQVFHCNFAFISLYFYICALTHLLDALSHFLLSAEIPFFRV
jgi:hypothetical protein